LLGLVQLAEALERFHLRYALIGGVAAAYRSHPRYTQDLDFLLEIPQLVLPRLLTELEARGFAFDQDKTIREWTQEHMTVLTFRGVQIDFLKPVVPLYQHVIDRARPEPWRGQAVRIAAPEGLILTKLVAFRPQDQFDIDSLLAANRDRLDLDFIRSEWRSVAGPDEPRTQWFEEAVQRLGTAP
jgi:hypothetical protein